ncbi:MAG: hypothetical protein J0L88_11265 [Xanthomonadales bacterium]|nr:hypothetical protein [Xanthomonadales bacterium]
MIDDAQEHPRRAVLRHAMELAAGMLMVGPGTAATRNDATPTPRRPTAGKPGDFDFLAGEWKIRHRRLKARGEWDEFDGEATCWSILGGIGSVEELRIPARDFSGLGLRLLDVDKRLWNDFWVNAKSGVLTTPGTTGSFEDGEGIFVADDVDGATPIKVRGRWDRITGHSHRWQQAVSRDGGRTWETGWSMDWTRA